MSALDLHPEELLEREADGDLTPPERARLDAHLAHCPACRMERRARADFEPEGSGPEPDVRALVARLVMPQLRVPAPPGRRVRRVHVLLFAAALLALSGLAAAALSVVSLRERAARPPEDRGGGERMTVVVAAARPQPPSGLSAAATTPEPPEAPGAPEPEATAIAPAQPAAPALPQMPSARALPQGLTGTARSFSPVAAQEARPVKPAETASSLFASANAARRRGDRAGAAATYRELQARHGASEEAGESLEVLGRMLLDDGSPADALPCFDAYLRRGGPLAAEAMLGKATALERLGRAHEERRAWRSLLDAYPESLYGDRARTRLAMLNR